MGESKLIISPRKKKKGARIMSNKSKIESIIIEYIYDANPDTSWLGEYTDERGAGIIIRELNKFYEDITEDELEEYYELYPTSREFRGFKPYAGGEEVGTKEYKEYGMLDFKRIEGLAAGRWYFIGIKAKADISFEESGVSHYQEICSGGIWGIESDNQSGIKEVEKEQIDNLKQQLEHLNVDMSNFDEIEIQHKERD